MERFRCQSRCQGQKETPDLLVHRAFLALLDETAEKANKALLAPLVLLVHKGPKATKATLEAVYQPLTSCLCT